MMPYSSENKIILDGNNVSKTCPAQKPFEQLQAMTAFRGFVDVDISYNICLNCKAWFSYREHLELDHHQLLVKNLSAEL